MNEDCTQLKSSSYKRKIWIMLSIVFFCSCSNGSWHKGKGNTTKCKSEKHTLVDSAKFVVQSKDSSCVDSIAIKAGDNKSYVGTDMVKLIQTYLNSSFRGKYTPPFDVFYDNTALREYDGDTENPQEEFAYIKSYSARLTLNGKSLYSGYNNVWYINLKGAHVGAFVLDFTEEGGDDNLKTKDNLSRALGAKLIKSREARQYDMYYYLYKIKGGYLYINYLIGGGAVWLHIRVTPYREYVDELYEDNEQTVENLNKDL